MKHAENNTNVDVRAGGRRRCFAALGYLIIGACIATGNVSISGYVHEPVWHANTPVPTESLLPRPVDETPLGRYLAGAILGSREPGKIGFCAYDSLGSDTRNDTTFVYIWAVCQAFDTVSTESLAQGSVASMPVVVAELASGSTRLVLGHWQPWDEEEDYAQSILGMFAAKYVWKTFDYTHKNDTKVEKLRREAYQKARQYFGVSK